MKIKTISNVLAFKEIKVYGYNESAVEKYFEPGSCKQISSSMFSDMMYAINLNNYMYEGLYDKNSKEITWI